MTMVPLAVILSAVFTILAGLHAYWGLGGKWGGSLAIPKTQDGTPLFMPGAAACLVVAIGLGVFAYISLALVRLAPLPPLRFPRHLLGLGLSAIFAARTVGDLRFFGLLRKVNNPKFRS